MSLDDFGRDMRQLRYQCNSRKSGLVKLNHSEKYEPEKHVVHTTLDSKVWRMNEIGITRGSSTQLQQTLWR